MDQNHVKFLGLRGHECLGAEIAGVGSHAGVEAVVDLESLTIASLVRAKVTGVNLGDVTLVDHHVDLERAGVVEPFLAHLTFVVPGR